MARIRDQDRPRLKNRMVSGLSAGLSESQAVKDVGISIRTHQRWMGNDPEYKDRCRRAQGRLDESPGPPVPGFEAFRLEAFGHHTYRHQQEWLRAIEGSDRNLILVPPAFGKTTMLSVEYPTWRIVSDRNSRGIVVSKSQEMGRKMLYSVKRRLTDQGFYRDRDRNVVASWGPFRPPSYERGELSWSSTKIYVSGIDSGEKDPTLEVLGVGTQIYGARADYIVLDDVATMQNQASPIEREKLLNWISQEVVTRLESDGKLIVVGTRVQEADVYSAFLEGSEPWLAGYETVVQPAILSDEAKESLCPEMWPYEELARRRDEVAPRTWALVYQQQASGMPDAPFSLETLAASRDKSFAVGDRASHLTVALGVDPALAGRTGLVVVGLDRKSGTRYIIDAKADRLLQPDRVKDTIVAFAARYRAQECRIEKNAMQGFLSRDSDLRDRLHAVGCRLTEEYTGRGNKYDPQWVVASVAAKFDAGAFRIPWGGTSPTKMRPLIEELASWRPGVKLVQDLVMALWFAELSCRGLERTVTFQNTRAVGIPGFVLDMRKPERWW